MKNHHLIAPEGIGLTNPVSLHWLRSQLFKIYDDNLLLTVKYKFEIKLKIR